MRLALSLLLVPLAAASLCVAADAPQPVVVSAVSPAVGVAPDSLSTIYGDHLATQSVPALSPPWPTALGDMPGVQITDSASQTKPVSLIYVSPAQMNIWIPPGVAPGAATITFPVTGLPPGAGTPALRTAPMNIQKVAPGLFSVDGTGTGIAAASAIRFVIATRIQSPVPVFVCTAGTICSASPIDVGIDAPVYLSLYGTGIRGASSLSNVKVTIGSTSIQPTYAGPQFQIPGLDQVNVPLPLSLRGSGFVNLTVTVDGVTSNTVQVAIQ